MMKAKYQQIMLPALSLLLTSCGGGGGGGGATAPTNHSPSADQGHHITERHQALTDEALASYTETEQSNAHIPLDQFGQPRIRPLKESDVWTLHPNTHFVDDENRIYDIAIIDTSYYLSDRFKKANGEYRLKLHHQPDYLGQNPTSHGTSVATVIDLYNKTATLYGYHESIGQGFFIQLPHYDLAHQQGVRIFNNSYATDASAHEYASYPGENIVKYAKEDSIFIWSAGNEKQAHASPESIYPIVDDDTRNGWIAVAEADYSKDIEGTLARKEYGFNSASNYIGEKAKTWGIATQGTYSFILPHQDGRSRYVAVQGTSFAAPRVSAAAANVWTQFPWMDHHLVIVSLLSTADQPGTFEQGQGGECPHKHAKGCGKPTTGPDAKFGWGLLNEKRALKGPARFDKRLLTNKDAIAQGENGDFQWDTRISAQQGQKDLLVVDLDFRHYDNKEKLTWRNDIQGDAGLLKQGNGTLYLTGKNTYQGKTLVNEGTLAIGHSLTSQVIINPKGTLLAEFETPQYAPLTQKVILAKSGNTEKNTVNNHGALHVYGAGLTIQGHYVGNPDSRIVMDIDKAELNITGTMHLIGTSQIVADIKDLSIPSQAEKERTLISAQAIINPQHLTYAKSDKINDYIDISQFYLKENQEIKIKYRRNSTAYVLNEIKYTPKSATQTARNVDKVLDSLSDNLTGTASPKAASLFRVDKKRLASVIDSLSGEIYASSQAVMVHQNMLTNQILSQRIVSVNQGKQKGVWWDTFYANSHIRQAGYAHANVTTTGSQLGVDHPLTDNLTLGIAINQSQTRADFNREAGNSTIKSTGAFLYGAYRFEHAYLASMTGFNQARSEVNRIVFDQPTNATFRSQLYNQYTELGAHQSFGKLKVNPYIAHTANQIQRGAFKESATFGVEANAKKYHIHTLMTGFRAEIDLKKWTLNTRLNHAYTLKKPHFGFEAKFTGFDDSIYITGAKQHKQMTWWHIGADYEFNENIRLQFNYHLSTREGKKENTLFNFGLSTRF